MAAEAEATREAGAKVIAAEGEQLASRGLSEAALTLAQNPVAINLSFLQTLNSISAEKNKTIVVPIPVEIVQAFLNKRFANKAIRWKISIFTGKRYRRK